MSFFTLFAPLVNSECSAGIPTLILGRFGFEEKRLVEQTLVRYDHRVVLVGSQLKAALLALEHVAIGEKFEGRVAYALDVQQPLTLEQHTPRFQ